MSDINNDGGPAYPVSVGTGPLSANFSSPGMSLRDWYVGLAMQGLLSNPNIIRPKDHTDKQGHARMAKACFVYADSMISERLKK